jgi:proteasome lid subunit RPN8/RPN11
MIGLVKIEKSVADSILSYALIAYPKEGILLLRGKVEEDAIRVNDVLIPPMATHGHGFSDFPRIMLPMDFSVIGVGHSHPSGALRPSIQDLNHFYGRIMAIAAYPFESYDNIGVFDNRGEKLRHEIVSDAGQRKIDL